MEKISPPQGSTISYQRIYHLLIIIHTVVQTSVLRCYCNYLLQYYTTVLWAYSEFTMQHCKMVVIGNDSRWGVVCFRCEMNAMMKAHILQFALHDDDEEVLWDCGRLVCSVVVCTCNL